MKNYTYYKEPDNRFGAIVWRVADDGETEMYKHRYRKWGSRCHGNPNLTRLGKFLDGDPSQHFVVVSVEEVFLELI